MEEKERYLYIALSYAVLSFVSLILTMDLLTIGIKYTIIGSMHQLFLIVTSSIFSILTLVFAVLCGIFLMEVNIIREEEE